MLLSLSRILFLLAIIVASFAGKASAAPSADAMPLVRGPVSDRVTTALVHDLPGALLTSRDSGLLDGRALLPHINLALKRPVERQAALDKLTHDQSVRNSPSYHRWLVPSELRAYGPASADIDKVVGWLTSHGLRVNSVSPSGMSIDFAGRADRVAAAFHTSLHYVTRAGEAHVSNISAPLIPAALSPVINGVTLANFFPKPTVHRKSPNFTLGGDYFVAPADFATIYNINPLRTGNNYYGATFTGTGITLAVLEQTSIKTADWVRFRQVFGLSGYGGTLSQINPRGCTAPGRTGDEVEAALDAEWSSAVAPSATIIEAACSGTAPFEFGVMTTLQKMVEYPTPATIFSISYGGDEIADGFAFEAAWTNLVQEGAAEGKAIFVSTGDSGTSSGQSIDTLGLTVNGLSDTAYNVAVGGTDFYDTALKENSTYWTKNNNSALGSAKSYVPEIPWDNSCASSIIWKYYKASGPIAFCNSADGQSPSYTQNGVGGTGSQSDFYTKPSWQLTSVPGVPDDGVRDQPDVSLFAGNGIWNHSYVFCMSDASEGGQPCNYQTLGEIFSNGETFGNTAGGTSFAAPAFAGIAALVQEADSGPAPLGNPAPVFYKIAKAQFTTPLGFTRCNATLGNVISPGCAFQYVTSGNNAEPCAAGTANCETSSLSTMGIGVLATKVGGKTVFAYPAQPGYSLATGLGSVNVTNLIYNYYVGL